MNGDDERDYDEEAAVLRDAVREGLAEQEAEQVAMEQAAEQWDEHAREVAGHMSGPEHYREAERILAETMAFSREVMREDMDEQMLALATQQQMSGVCLAQCHALLALAAATAMNIRRNGAVEAVDEAAGWTRVLS